MARRLLFGARSSGCWSVLVAEARPRPYVSGVVAHGWNIDEGSPCPGWLLVRQVRLFREAVTGWNAVGRVVGVRRAHCWVLRPPAGLLLVSGVSGVSGSSTGHEVRVIPATVAGPVRWVGEGWLWCHGLPGGFVRCLRTA